VAVAYIDLDGFKAVNDTHGHAAGDQLLRRLAARMNDALRDGDTLARIGGDEFVAVLTDLQPEQDCDPILTRLLGAAAEPVVTDAVTLRVSASIGVSLYSPNNEAPVADLLMRQADQAMYRAKQLGKNRYAIYPL
jgi:diguanylate cyclase (GGDEF)-like protein